jgi:hypothetical protein
MYLIAHYYYLSKIVKSYGRTSNLSDEFRKTKLDLVYLWVDMDDPVWSKKQALDLNKPYVANLDIDPNNYREIEFSIMYSMKYMKDILGTIYIVTNNQIPKWLESSPYKSKIKIIDHSEIIPSQFLPCYNSIYIEMFIGRIPGLSKWSIHMNDDMFINDYVTHDTFFVTDNIVRFVGYDGLVMTNKLYKKIMPHCKITHSRCTSWELYKKVDRPDKNYYLLKGHSPTIINKYILEQLLTKYWKYVVNGHTPMRHSNNIYLTQFIYIQYMYHNKMAVFSNDYSYKFVDYTDNISNNSKYFKMIDNVNPTFFAINERNYAILSNKINNKINNKTTTKLLTFWLKNRLIKKHTL